MSTETPTLEPPRAAPPSNRTASPRPAVHGYSALLRGAFEAATGVSGRREPAGQAARDFRCALCGTTRARERFAEEIPDRRGYTVVQCEHCDLVVTHPAPSFEDIPALYGPAYYGEDNAKFGRFTELFVRLFRRARLRALRLMNVPKGDVLDIGCARGLFLRHLQAHGYRAFGTELSESSAATAQKLLGEDRVRVGRLCDAAFEDERFVAVTAWQVFEHLHDPTETLDECHRVLQPGGALLLAVPNIESWQARWAGAEWFHLDVPRHLYHYSPETLTSLLARAGFEVEHVSHHNLEQNPFGLLQSALHRLGRPHLGLYDLLRGAHEPSKRSRLQRLWRYAAYLAVFPCAAAVSCFWSALGHGATFTVLARKV